MTRSAPSAIDHALALGLAIATIVLLAMTADMGFTRDEGFYFDASAGYAGWFEELEQNAEDGQIRESFSQDGIDRHWGYNPEHPVLVKTAFALSHLLLDERWDVLSPSLAFRFPAFVFTGILVWFLFAFTRRAFNSRAAAVLAPLFLLTIPRFFFHAHLTCFDVPMTAVWMAFMYAYWRSLTSTRWAWITGALWGVALITKLNGFFLPFVLLAHWGIRALPATRLSREGRIQVPPVPFALFAMAVLGPIIFYAGWPRHWFDTWNRVAWYFGFHMNHEHYFVWYFGQALIRPPFPVSFPFVMTLVTTPLPLLMAFFGGSGVLLKDWFGRLRARTPDPLGTGLLVALNIAIPFLIIARPSTPVFGGIKHWFPALPFMCAVAAIGIVRAAALLTEHVRGQQAWFTALAGMVLSVGLMETVASHPYGTSHYNALVGGYTGAADRDGMRQFWGYASRGALDWLNENAEEGARVHFQNTTGRAAAMYKQEGWLRDDIHLAWSVESADYFLLHHQESFEPLHAEVWLKFGTQSPVHVVTVRGVPVLSVYRNERRADERAARANRDAERDAEAAEDTDTAQPDEGSGDASEGSGDASEGSGDASEGSGDASEGSGDASNTRSAVRTARERRRAINAARNAPVFLRDTAVIGPNAGTAPTQGAAPAEAAVPTPNSPADGAAE